MELFLGYDPGGDGKHGVASVRVAADGSSGDLRTDCLRDATEVRDWLRDQASPAALGIDTLLAWSSTGGRRHGRKSGRACDIALRNRYPEHSNSVVAQNSLYSAMTINGVLIAMAGCEEGLPLVESHPKLLVRAAQHADLEMKNLCQRYEEMTRRGAGHREATDHEADAVIAAWCASRSYLGRWSVDLYDIDANSDDSDDLVFPAGIATYPWPEAIGA